MPAGIPAYSFLRGFISRTIPISPARISPAHSSGLALSPVRGTSCGFGVIVGAAVGVLVGVVVGVAAGVTVDVAVGVTVGVAVGAVAGVAVGVPSG